MPRTSLCLGSLLLLFASGCGSESEILDGGKFLKPPHFVDSFPMHGDTLTQPPEEILVNFNFNLHPTATRVRLLLGSMGIPVAMSIAPDQLSLRAVPQTRGTPEGRGTWTVELDACWPDASCHDGRFSFEVDPSAVARYQDQRGKSAVTVRMNHIAFDQPLIMVTAGTRVTWINDEDAVHFVNTDPHPSHNLQPSLNSKALARGESYSFVFDRPGEWGYHCSAHTTMTGKVLVRP